MFSFRSFALALAIAPAPRSVHPLRSPVPPCFRRSRQFFLVRVKRPRRTRRSRRPPTPTKFPERGGRIRERKAKRRAQAIHDIYSHLYEGYVGMGYMALCSRAQQAAHHHVRLERRVHPLFNELSASPSTPAATTGTAYVGLNPINVTRPAIATYSGMLGPTYRFLTEPRYSISGRAMAGYIHSDFSGDTNGFGTALLGLYPDGGTYAASVSIAAEYNLSNNLGLRLAPEYNFSGFGSSLQASRGFTRRLRVPLREAVVRQGVGNRE